MARPLRHEASGAVYQVMARGDGGKSVFEDDKDRHGWVDLLERACERFGWRVHARVLGEKGFVETVLAALGGQDLAEKKGKGSAGGEAVKAHDETEAARIATASLAMPGLPDDAEKLAGRGRWLQEKAVIGAKIRNARLDRVPYMLVIGAREAEDGTVAIRHRDHDDLGVKPLEEFIANITGEIKTRSL